MVCIVIGFFVVLSFFIPRMMRMIEGDPAPQWSYTCRCGDRWEWSGSGYLCEGIVDKILAEHHCRAR